MAKTKKLTLAKVDKKNKEQLKMIPHTFKDGETLKFLPVFPIAMVEDLITEFYEDMFKFDNEENLDVEIKEKLQYSEMYLFMLAAFRFTELSDELSDVFAEKVNQIATLLKSDYSFEIMQDMFLKEELFKLKEHHELRIATLANQEENNKRLTQIIADFNLENKDEMQNVIKTLEDKRETAKKNNVH